MAWHGARGAELVPDDTHLRVEGELKASIAMGRRTVEKRRTLVKVGHGPCW